MKKHKSVQYHNNQCQYRYAMGDFKNVNPNYTYKVKLDPSLSIPDTWIDS